MPVTWLLFYCYNLLLGSKPSESLGLLIYRCPFLSDHSLLLSSFNLLLLQILFIVFHPLNLGLFILLPFSLVTSIFLTVDRVAQLVQRLGYGLDGPGSNPSVGEIFRLSRPALEPTQPPVKWVLGLSRGKNAAGACC